MRLDSLDLRDFRNFAHAEITLSPAVNIFVGANAQGKTNLIEAVYLLAIGRSFRTTDEHEMVRHGADDFRLVGDFVNSDGARSLIEYAAGVHGRSVKQNSVPLRRAQDLFGRVRVVLFSPDDLQLLKGGPEHRRAYLDLYLAQTNPSYRYALYHFHRLIVQRNEVLRRIRDGLAGRDELAVWNESLIRRASEVVGERMTGMTVLAPLAARYHRRLSGGAEEIHLSYRLNGRTAALLETDFPEYFRRELAGREREELGRGLTLVGPHRDDIGVGLASGHDLRSFGSQGQQRTAALAMKLAAVDFLSESTGETPLILLDDVLSEFDDARKSALLRLLLESNQTLVTATHCREFAEVPRFRAYHVEQGRLAEGDR